MHLTSQHVSRPTFLQNSSACWMLDKHEIFNLFRRHRNLFPFSKRATTGGSTARPRRIQQKGMKKQVFSSCCIQNVHGMLIAAKAAGKTNDLFSQRHSLDFWKFHWFWVLRITVIYRRNLWPCDNSFFMALRKSLAGVRLLSLHLHMNYINKF